MIWGIWSNIAAVATSEIAAANAGRVRDAQACRVPEAAAPAVDPLFLLAAFMIGMAVS